MIQDKAVNSLILFFNALQTYKGHANEGSQFEEIIRQLLRNYGFMQKQWDKTNDQIFNLSLKESTKKNIKKQIIEKNNIELIRNPDKNLAYIYISAFWISKLSWFFGDYWRMNNSNWN